MKLCNDPECRLGNEDTFSVGTSDSHGSNTTDAVLEILTSKWSLVKPQVTMFEKSGMYSPIKDGGTSKVEGDTWTFDFAFYVAGDGGK